MRRNPRTASIMSPMKITPNERNARFAPGRFTSWRMLTYPVVTSKPASRSPSLTVGGITAVREMNPFTFSAPPWYKRNPNIVSARTMIPGSIIISKSWPGTLNGTPVSTLNVSPPSLTSVNAPRVSARS